MLEPLNEKISVMTIYDRVKGTVIPRKIKWNGKQYNIKKVGYYHKTRIGREIIHVFHVTDGNLDFRLECSSENLHWTLKEVSDGTAN